MANTTGDDTHEHFVADGLVNVDVFYGQRLVGAVWKMAAFMPLSSE